MCFILISSGFGHVFSRRRRETITISCLAPATDPLECKPQLCLGRYSVGTCHAASRACGAPTHHQHRRLEMARARVGISVSHSEIRGLGFTWRSIEAHYWSPVSVRESDVERSVLGTEASLWLRWVRPSVFKNAIQAWRLSI